MYEHSIKPTLSFHHVSEDEEITKESLCVVATYGRVAASAYGRACILPRFDPSGAFSVCALRGKRATSDHFAGGYSFIRIKGLVEVTSQQLLVDTSSPPVASSQVSTSQPSRGGSVTKTAEGWRLGRTDICNRDGFLN
jgi:hypothetical protein